jgi:hypothetical protein
MNKQTDSYAWKNFRYNKQEKCLKIRRGIQKVHNVLHFKCEIKKKNFQGHKGRRTIKNL